MEKSKKRQSKHDKVELIYRCWNPDNLSEIETITYRDIPYQRFTHQINDQNSAHARIRISFKKFMTFDQIYIPPVKV